MALVLRVSKIGRKIFGFGKKNSFKFVPCVEVTFLSKFYPIWMPIAQESSLERKGRILGEVCVSKKPQPDFV
jgi:hypothetical protein